MCVIFFRMPCQSMGRYIGRYPHAAEIFAEYTEAADPVGMIRCTFIAAFLAPMIAEFLGKPLFGKLMMAKKNISILRNAAVSALYLNPRDCFKVINPQNSSRKILLNPGLSISIHRRGRGRTPKAFFRSVFR